MAVSAGILMYRQTGPDLEVLLVHPGGPFWRNKDEGAWSIPKGEMHQGENAAVAARREFLEETGCALSGSLEPLGDIRQRGGKRVTAFAVEGDLDVDALASNTFEIEWPPKCCPFRRSTALPGSICPPPTLKLCRVSGHCSIDSSTIPRFGIHDRFLRSPALRRCTGCGLRA
jgi:predicted NUDIX family NTP pyrophosphohydrolase